MKHWKKQRKSLKDNGMDILTILLIAIAGMFLFFNLYARKRLLSSYRKLQKANVEFQTKHIFNRELREEEIHKQYPEHIEEVELFCQRLRDSIKYAIIIFLAILGLGALSMGLNG